MATPFFTPALEDIGPDAGPKADAAPAGADLPTWAAAE